MNLKVFYQKEIHILDISQIYNLQQLAQHVQSQLNSPPLSFTLRVNYLGGVVIDQYLFEKIKDSSIKLQAVYVMKQYQISDEMFEVNNQSEVIKLQFDQKAQQYQKSIKFDQFMSVDMVQIESNQTNSCQFVPIQLSQKQKLVKSNQNNFKQSNKDLPQNSIPKAPTKQVVLQSIQCDICFAFPITGPIYKCLVCKQFDLCQTCQQKYHHFHPSLKITTKDHYPAEIVIFFSQQKEKFMKKQMKAQTQQIARQKRQLFRQLPKQEGVIIDPQTLQSQTIRSKCFLRYLSKSDFRF